MEQWQLFQVMPAQLLLFRDTILFTVTSQGQQCTSDSRGTVHGYVVLEGSYNLELSFCEGFCKSSHISYTV